MLNWKGNSILLLLPAFAGILSHQAQAQHRLSPLRPTEPPILSICTENFNEIQREDKIRADIATLPYTMATYRGGTPLCASVNATSGQAIKIRRRGFSSDRFAKKQYSVDFVTPSGDDLKVAMLDLPEAEEWVLNGPYVDRSYIRNNLAYNIGSMMGAMRGEAWAAPKTRFVELYLNDNYAGLYVLTEKIQRGKNKVDIPKFDLEKNDELSYILEVSTMTSDVHTRYKTSIEYSYPGRKKLERMAAQDPAGTERLKNRMLADVERFEGALKSSRFADPRYGYRPLIDVPSFIDYFLIREAFKDIDGFRRSAYFYKGRDQKIHMGPLWDFNIAAGNMRWWGMGKAKGWVHGNIPLYTKEMFWYKRLLEDPYFTGLVVKRYRELRAPGNPLHPATIKQEIAQLTAEMGTAPLRDYKRWGKTFGLVERFVLNTKPKSKTAAGQIAILQDFLTARLQWLDYHITDLYRRKH